MSLKKMIVENTLVVTCDQFACNFNKLAEVINFPFQYPHVFEASCLIENLQERSMNNKTGTM